MQDYRHIERRCISTHAPAGGATLGIFTLCLLVQQFLLTPLREGRRVIFYGRVPEECISTHAPAGGAT